MDMRILGAALVLAGLAAGPAGADNGNGNGNGNGRNLSARLTGYNEVPLAINSPGSGTIELSVDEGAGTINYTLSYSGVTSPVTQAHIHFGQRHVAGGIIAFLCSNLPSPPAGTPACPQFEGSVNGIIGAESVRALDPQNVAAGDFSALVGAIANKAAYANVHTTRFPAGEIRGQVSHKHEHEHN